MAVQGLLSIYTILISYLYSPRKLENSDPSKMLNNTYHKADVHFSNKKGENVYQMENLGDDDEEEEEKEKDISN